MYPVNNQLIPKVARRFPTLGSTNVALLTALSAGQDLAAGSVFIADSQTAGRGQGGNHWHATAGDNLTFSLLLRPDHLAVDRLFILSQYTSLVIARTLVRLLPPHLAHAVSVKWPNDVYVGSRKIAGILIQNGLQGSLVAWSVIGIGLNVNERAFPQELKNSATSLARITGEVVDLTSVLNVLFQEFQNFYHWLAPAGHAELDRQYHEMLYRRGETSGFLRLATQEVFTAEIEGVAANGHLLLKHAGGNRETFDLREVRLLPHF